MIKYVPFLKIKANELGALLELDDSLKSSDFIIPFLDFARKDEMDNTIFIGAVESSHRSISKKLEKYDTFFLYNFDIPDNIRPYGNDNYHFIAKTFSDLPFIPVVGVDRSEERNNVVINLKKSGDIQSNTIALRITSDDFSDYDLIEDELEELINKSTPLFDYFILILDNRLCLNADVTVRSAEISSFIRKIFKLYGFDDIIITGSSIPASIGEIAQTETEVHHSRKELDIFMSVKNELKTYELSLGDYTIVSPLYSDIDIPPEAMQNVTAPKILYAYDNMHLILRGGALKTHRLGIGQYNEMARYLVGLSVYRKKYYSYGDNFIDEKARKIGSNVTPSSILKPTINAHITYMIQDMSI